MRWIKPKWFCVILNLTLFLSVSESIHADTLLVTTTNDAQDTSDGKCSLREAVASINAGAVTDASCSSFGSSDNVIQLSNAIYCLSSELTIRNTVTLAGISGGSTTLDGGNGGTTHCETASQSRIISITTDGITVTFNDIIIQGGMDTTGGGGIYLNGLSTVNLNQSQVIFNQVTNTDTFGANGGGIYAHECEALTLKNTLVEENLASASGERAFGGGLSAVLCNSVTIENSTFNQNQATTAAPDKGAYGGGIFLSIDTATITNSTFSYNEAIHTGTETSSSSNSYGGGVYAYGKMINIVNTTISGNKSQGKDDSYGGGLFTKEESTIHIAHSTIAYNEVTGSINAYGGGIAHFPADKTGTTDETINIINTILVNNTALGTTASKGENCYGKVYTFGTNLFSNTSDCILDDTNAGTTVIDYTGSNAELSSLADNGGVVKTHAISSSSDAKDKGTCLDVMGNTMTTDARGATREAPCDIGAYEYGGDIETTSSGETGATIQSSGCSFLGDHNDH